MKSFRRVARACWLAAKEPWIESGQSERTPLPGDLWAELGESMRRFRHRNGLSLRHVESISNWSRGTLSQAENAKARPSRALVAWYDDTFHAHDLLMSIYAEASVSHAEVRAVAAEADLELTLAGDRMSVVDSGIPAGFHVRPSTTHEAWWKLRNAGSVPWRNRGLRRVGAYAGVRVINSDRVCGLTDAEPGQTIEARLALVAPSVVGTVVAYWRVEDAHGRYCFAFSDALCVLLTVA